MKKIFTLVAMAAMAIGVNAQDHEPGLYECKSITWKDITWKNGNNKKDKDNKDMLYLMGTGNGYKDVMAEYFWSESQSEYQTRADYTYIDYENGETGVPGYGLYYKFTPKVDGQLVFNAWVNKGGDNRKVFVVKASDGKPLTPFTDYFFDGYINGKNQEGTNIPLYYNATEFKQWRDEQYGGAGNKPYKLSGSNNAVWGWITLNVTANESYYIYQQSSQLGFGGYTFTPNNGVAEDYVAVLDMGGTMVLAPAFSAVVDESGKATNVTIEGSVVEFSTANMNVKACGGAEPNAVEADFTKPISTGIENVKAAAELKADAAIYNLAGQKVDAAFKGMVIQNGKKFINK